MTFHEHADMVRKKAQQRLFPLSKFRSVYVSQYVLGLVYRSLVESILTLRI